MKLDKWMEKNKITVRQMCLDLRYTRNYIYRAMKGKTPVGRKLAEVISEYTLGDVTLKDMGYKPKEKCLCPTCGKVMSKK